METGIYKKKQLIDPRIREDDRGENMENFEEPKKPKKVLKIILLVVLVILILGSGASAYYYFDKSKKAKSEMDTAKEAAESAKTELDKVEKSVFEKTAEVAKDADVGETDDCESALTSDEQTVVSDWETHTSSTYNYSIKHPSDWTVIDENADSVTLTSAGDEEDSASMQMRTGTATEIGFGGYTLNTEDTTLVDCLDALVKNYSVDANGRMIVTNTISSGKTFLFMFSYEYAGASQDASLVELNDLIIKTVDFD